MTKAQAETCAKCAKCRALINKMFLVKGVCVWCKKSNGGSK